MQKVIHRAADRGQVDFGWLKSSHSFSFGHFYDPTKINFGALRVLNDDFVEPKMGFGKHPHDNMEIVSIPLSGSLKHSDSMNNWKTIQAGEVQIMSAGTGVEHAEMNDSETEAVQFLQIWVIPKEQGIRPAYEQKFYSHLDKKNKFITIVSPNQADTDAVYIHQDAWFNLADIDAQQELSYDLHGKTQGAYIFVLEGAVKVGDEQLQRRDALGIYDIERVTIQATEDAQVLLIEVPMF